MDVFIELDCKRAIICGSPGGLYKRDAQNLCLFAPSWHTDPAPAVKIASFCDAKCCTKIEKCKIIFHLNAI